MPRGNPRPLKERFFEKLPPESERDPDKCMEWQACLNEHGYGTINAGGNDRRPVLAHRFAWEFATGRKIPEGMFICHHCDNPKCVNPFHLYLGTHATNMRNMADRGRGRGHGLRGEANGKAKVPDRLVREAVSLVKSGSAQESAAQMIRDEGYPCKQATVSRWVRGKDRQSAFAQEESQDV